MPPALDLTRTTFGRLRPLRPTDRRVRGEVAWECLCAPELGGCGRTARVPTSSLTSGNTRSCGCLHDEAVSGPRESIQARLAGRRCGTLTALRPTDARDGGSVVWECRCACGREVRRAQRLLARRPDGCGHGCPERTAARRAKRKALTVIRRLIARYRITTEETGGEFERPT